MFAKQKFPRPSEAFAAALPTALILYLSARAAAGQEVIAWGNNFHGQLNVPASATNVIAVAAGGYHSLALRADGTVVAWGAISPVPSDLAEVQAIASGVFHAVALRSNGTLVVWGDNAYGQTNVPPAATNVVAIAAGYHHTLALRADGTVVAWGKNTSGQINVPVGLSNVVAVAAGEEHSMALLDDGTIVNWGRPFNPPGFLRDAQVLAAAAWQNLAVRPNGKVVRWGNYDPTLQVPSAATNTVAIVAGTNFNLALSTSGRILAWGAGQLTNVPASATNVVAIAAGLSHGLALKGDGSPRILGSVAYRSIVSMGDTLPLSARTVSSRPVTFQWLVDGQLINTNTRTPLIPALIASEEIHCQAIVSNSLGSATSAVAKITVRGLSVWGDNRNGQRNIPRSVGRPVAITAGGFHVLAVQPDGSVVGWGKNWNGQTNVPSAASNVVALAAGSDHSLALRADGTVVAWGRNWDGQTDVPAAATNVVAIAAGAAHSAALRADGTVIAWGSDEYQQSSVSFLATEVIAIACGYHHTLALRADGTVVSWGSMSAVPAAATNVVAIAAGFEHNLALRGDGTVIAWGDDTFGQSTVPASATNVVAIAAGWYHNAVLRADGSVVAWGKDYDNGATNVPGGLRDVVSIAVGEDFTAALVRAGPPEFGRSVSTGTCGLGRVAVLTVGVQGTHPMSFQWYRDGTPVVGATNATLVLTNARFSDAGNYVLVASNRFGVATNQPIALTVSPAVPTVGLVGAWGETPNGQDEIPANLVSPRQIAAGRGHCLALQADGRVIAWGDNVRGQTNVPPDATNIIAIAAGGAHSLALRADGRVIAWGDHLSGQTNVPVHATNIVAVAAGMDHSVALRKDGSVIVWGENVFMSQTNVPPLFQKAVAIGAGYYHTLAVLEDRTVVCWGATTAVPPSVTNVIAVAGGFNHSLALRADGTVVAWGDNTFGQTEVPLEATNVIAIAAGFYHSLALRADGTVVAWGAGPSGAATVPRGLGRVARITAREAYCLALVETGPPRPASGPIEVTAHTGARAVLTADVAGTRPLLGQWFHGGTPIDGADRFVLTLPSVQIEDAGEYRFYVTNRSGEAEVLAAHLTVLESPLIMSRPARKPVLPGASVCLPTEVFGAEPKSYLWLRNGQVLTDDGHVSGTTTATLCLDNASYNDTGDYSLVVSNGAGTVTGFVGRVVVNPILAWGKNFSEQTDVPPSASNVVAIAAGGDSSACLTFEGAIQVWGDGTDNQNRLPSGLADVIAMALGDAHVLALRADGSVVAWGDNTYGQTNVPSSLAGVMAIAAGATHSLALRTNGAVSVWGTPANAVPNAITVAAGDSYSMGLRSDGTIWGGAASPPPLSNIVAIAAGDAHSLALTTEGTVIAWGNNYFGQTNVPPAATNIVAIAAGGDVSVALRADGAVIAWGENSYGETDVPPLATNVIAIAAGADHVLALHGGSTGPRSVRLPPKAAVLGDQAWLLVSPPVIRGTVHQWQLNGRNLVGATNVWLQLNAAHWTNAGVYRLVVSNLFGVTFSEPVTLTVLRTPLRFDPASVQMNPAENQFQARLLGASGVGPVIVYASADGQVWSPVFTNPPVIGSIDFLDTLDPARPVTLYRAAETPMLSPISLVALAPERQNGSLAFPLRISGLSAVGPVTILASTNLVDWQSIFTNPPTIGPIEFWDASPAPQPVRFYRASEVRP